MVRSVISLFSSLVLCSSAFAMEVKIGNTPIRLDPPAGYCEMDRSLTADSRLFNVIESMLQTSGNRLLSVSADCRELKDWRSGSRPLLDHLVQYQTLRSVEDSGVGGTPEAVVQEACKAMRAQGEQLVAETTKDAKQQAERVLEKIRVNEMKFLGVLEEEPLACYAAILQKFKTDIGTEKVQINLVAITVIKNKVLYGYYIAPFTSGDTMFDLLADARKAISEVQSANR